MKPLGSIKGVPTFSEQYEDPIPQFDDGTVVYENQRHMQSAQQPGATSVGYPPLYPRSNPKVLTNGQQQQHPYRQTISQPPQYHYQ